MGFIQPGPDNMVIYELKCLGGQNNYLDLLQGGRKVATLKIIVNTNSFFFCYRYLVIAAVSWCFRDQYWATGWVVDEIAINI